LCQQVGVIGIVLDEHVPESIANHLAVVLVNAGFDLFLHDCLKLFAWRYIHNTAKLASISLNSYWCYNFDQADVSENERTPASRVIAD